jgi:hypothetical protein
MDKIFIIKYENRILRAYNSKSEAEKYYKHVMNFSVKSEKFTKDRASHSSGYSDKLQLIAIPISQEGDSLDMRLGNCHAGGGELAVTYELCKV